ncbi:MAG TPA: hypothetical protein VEX86_15565 [Longimicrobium sp.]|nr:hypothetical protein [Longimicrobium sp.]
MGKRFDMLLAPAVLVSLAVLLANDFLLKPALHDALTGKLSDFAGLFVFGVFWCAVFPNHRRTVAAVTALGFIYWKSPAAQPLIDAWNGLGLFPTGRVIDPTDLVALVMVPLACGYRPRPSVPTRARRMLAPGAAAACVFAFAATSLPIHSLPVTGASYTLPLTRSEVLRRVYELRLDYGDRGVPHAESARGPDTLDLTLAPARSAIVTRSQSPWRTVMVDAIVADRREGGSTITLVRASSPDKADMMVDAVRLRFERGIVEPLRRNQPSPVQPIPQVDGPDRAFAPRVLTPESLTESRARVTISLARPAHVALVEVTPDEDWRLIYPTRSEDEALLPAGTHTLATACANEPAQAPPVAPGQPVPPCARARAVTPREVGRLSRTPRRAGACHPAPTFGVGGPGTLILIATDVPLRRATLQAHVEGYCGVIYFYEPGASPLVKAVRASGSRKWASVQSMLRR